MTDPTETAVDFGGCNRKCRRAGAHTLVWGECEHAPEPEPTVSLSRVYKAADGFPATGFDTYTVQQLAELLEPALRRVTVRLGPNSRALLERGETVGLSGGEYADLAREAAHAIVYRTAPAVVSAAAPSTDQAASGSGRAAEAELYVLLRKAGVDRYEAQALIDRHVDEVLHRAELRRLAAEAPKEQGAQADEMPASEELVHIGWWCWRGDNHGHLTAMACRSDNVPLHVPAEWADEMRALMRRIEDGDDVPAVVEPAEAANETQDEEADRA